MVDRDAPGRTYAMVADLLAGTWFVAADPFGPGVTVAEGGGKKLRAWIDAPGYTDRPGTSMRVGDVPPGATSLSPYA